MYILLIAFIICLVIISFFVGKDSQVSLRDEHLLITGGSSGIGLALAIDAVSKGGSVTLVARNQERLTEAQKLVQKYIQRPDQKVLMFSADVTEGPESLEDIVKQAEEIAGPITILVNCAGTSVSYRFDEMPIENFQNMMNINYLGSVYMTRAVLPYMKSRRKGKIVFFSSLAGLVGVYGYTAYSASKFALAGMAQALQMEVEPYGINVTVSFPPDTNTPGLAAEMETKPLETRVISETAGLVEASTVAAKTLKDVMNKRFMSSVGFEGSMLCCLGSGGSPVSSLTELIFQVLTMGAFRIVGYIYLADCKKKVRRCMVEREEKNKQQ